ncbi:suppressor of fused domain protein [Actinoallomurus oryzae]
MPLSSLALSSGRSIELSEPRLSSTYGGMLEGYPCKPVNDMKTRSLLRIARALARFPRGEHVREDRCVPSRVESYLAHLDRLSGGVEPRFLPVASTKENLKGVTVIAYQDMPEDLTTALTYGLSLAEHPDWKFGRPELCLSVRSKDDRWAWAVGYLAEDLRGSCPFSYGNTIDFGERVSPESDMTAFVVFAPAVADRTDCRIDVSPPGHEGHDIIHLAGLYPIHGTERQYIDEHGLQPFWELDWDAYDVARRPVV